MSSLLDALLAAFAAVPAIEWAAAALALGYLLLAIRQNPWCWGFAIASAALYLVVFARAGLYMQAALQVFYVGISLYGWRTWRGTAITRLRRFERGGHLLIAVEQPRIRAEIQEYIRSNAGKQALEKTSERN